MDEIAGASLPAELGVMALPGAILFPNALLPLYIFEPRYRLMLRRALQSHRMFAIGLVQTLEQDPPEVFEIGGAGVIRACIRNADDTSNLILQGVSRVRFIEWVQTRPYRIARVVHLASQRRHSAESEPLIAKLLAFCSELAQRGVELPSNFTNYLAKLDDPDVFGDLIASTLIPDPLARQDLLQQLDVPARLCELLAQLQSQLGEQDLP